MRNNVKVAPALKPRSSRAAPVSPCVFYKVHEQSGTTLSDSLGNGPDLTIAGTGTPLSNAGWFTGNGTDNYASVATSAYLQALLRQDADFGQILIGFDIYHDGDLTAAESLFSCGKNAAPGNGMFTITLNSAEQVQLVTRGVSASAALTTTMGGYSMTGVANTRVALLLELIKTGAGTMDAVLYANGVQVSTASAINLLANAATAPYGANEGDGYTIGARNGATAKDQLLNVGGSTGRVGRLFIMRRATRDAALALQAALELARFQGEFPVCLDGQ